MLVTGGIPGPALSTVRPSGLIDTRRGVNRGVVRGFRAFPRQTLSRIVTLILINRGRLGRALSWHVVAWVCSLCRLFPQLHDFVGLVQCYVSVQ